MIQQTNLISISTDELISIIKGAIEAAVKQAISKSLPIPINKTNGFLTRDQAAEKLHITLPTLHAWTKSGRLVAHRIGRRVLYNEDELDQSIRAFRNNEYND
ncbi:helix-turn-helix domain-containing protein [Rudanella lutea]|uniref:helix-turn-helix domain-containing protein n=1 Tax=Rudanella lutea TaxID=451374 RepID=UPI00036479EB